MLLSALQEDGLWAQQTQAADAVLPAGMSLNWEQVKVETVNAQAVASAAQRHMALCSGR